MRRHWLGTLAYGTLSGLAASWVMERVQMLGSGGGGEEESEGEHDEEKRGDSQSSGDSGGSQASGRESEGKESEGRGGENGQGDESQSQIPSEPATVLAARSVAGWVGQEIPEHRKDQAGELMHYLYGAFCGVLYGVLAPKDTRILLPGLAYGAALWLIGDELAVPALGLSAPVTEYPASVHGKSFGVHLVFGLTTAAGVRALDALT